MTVYLGIVELIVINPTTMSEKNIGDISDGYHTFNELYEHRHVLFSVICKHFNGWKSKRHNDGTMFEGGWFIAGVNTPQGQATYHIPMRLWDDFKCEELAQAPEWDGHTADDVIDRIKSYNNPNT